VALTGFSDMIAWLLKTSGGEPGENWASVAAVSPGHMSGLGALEAGI
jgi:hypothetical protein